VFSSIIHRSLDAAFLWCSVLQLVAYTVVTVIFRYYTVSAHEAGNCNMERMLQKVKRNVRKFLNAGEWSPCIVLLMPLLW